MSSRPDLCDLLSLYLIRIIKLYSEISPHISKRGKYENSFLRVAVHFTKNSLLRLADPRYSACSMSMGNE